MNQRRRGVFANFGMGKYPLIFDGLEKAVKIGVIAFKVFDGISKCQNHRLISAQHFQINPLHYDGYTLPEMDCRIRIG